MCWRDNGHYASQGGHLPRMQIMERTTGKTTWRPPPHMHDECPCNHAYTQVPIQTREKLWTTALVSGVTSTKVLLF